jgi:YVTN family beta-propeller protein
VTFNEALNSSTNLAALFAVAGPNGLISGTTSQTGPATVTFTPSAPLVANSVYTISINGGVDLAGNLQTVPNTASFTTVDTIPPVLQLISPSDGKFTNSAQPQIVIAASDNITGVDPASVTLSIDGNAVTPQASPAQITFTPATPLAEGQHTLAATAADRAGNVTHLSGSFSVDTVPPTPAQISGVTDGQIVKGSLTLSAISSDSGSGVARIDLLLDGNPLIALSPPAFQTTLDTTALGEGPHVLTARATDVAGNVGATGPPVHTIVDNLPLNVSIASPAAGSRLHGSVTVVTSVSEPVQQVQITLGSQTVTVTSAPFQATFDLSTLPDGFQTITASATGFGGESATSSVIVGIRAAAGCTPAPAGLVSWWPGDGNADDLVRSNHGALAGGAGFATGEIKQAFAFNGSSGVELGNPSSLNITGPITLNAWINPNSLDSYRTVFDQLSTGNNLGEIEFRTNPFGAFDFFRRTSQGSVVVQGASTQTRAAAGTWQHVAAVFDGSSYQIYVNGVLDPGNGPGSSALTSYTASAGPGSAIGANLSAPAEGFNGLIDEVQIFNRALSASEVQEIFLAGSEGQCKLPGATTAYVSNLLSGDISVIDAASNKVITTIPAGDQPSSIAVTPNGESLYVVNNSSAATVSAISTLTNQLVATVKVGNTPAGVAITPDGLTAYVTNEGANNVSVISTRSNTVTATIPVGSAPDGIAITPNGQFAYVVNNGSSNVSVINIATNAVVANIPVGSDARAVAISPDGARAFVANTGSNTVSIIDTSSNSVTATVPTAGTGPGAVAFTPDGKSAYVALGGSNSVAVLDATTGNLKGEIAVDQQPLAIAISPDGNFVYVANGNSNDVSVIATATNSLVATIPVDSRPAGIALTPVTTQTAGSVAGVVTDSNGQPVSGAQLTLQSASGLFKISSSQDGSYRFDGIKPGNVILAASSAVSGSGSATSTLAAGQALILNLQLIPSGALTGVVLRADGATPAAGINIALSSSNKTAITDSQGKYTIDAAPLGAFTVDATDPATGDRGRTSAQITANDQVVAANITLNGLGSVKVQVRDSSSNVVAGAQVTLISQTVFGGTQKSTTLADGSATFASVFAGTFVVTVTNPANGQSASTTAAVAHDTTVTINVQLSVGTCVPPPSGLVSWWPAEGNADDIAGANSGSLQGGVSFAPGLVGQAFLLDGLNAFVDAGNAPSLQVSGGDFSALAWVNFNALLNPSRGTPVDMSILDKMSAAGTNVDGWLIIKQSDNRFWFCLGGRDSNRCFLPSNTVFSQTVAQTGVWYHVAAVKSATDFSIYLNGVLEDTRPLPTSPPFLDTNSTDLLIGADALEGAHLDGLLDEVQLFHRALSSNEIGAIFHAGTAGVCQLPTVPLRPVTYAMPDGGDGPYRDNTYSGNGCLSCDGAPLSGGLGKLTDGVLGGDDWASDPKLWVGWDIAEPTITFDFGDVKTFGLVRIHSNNFQTGAVFLWDAVTLDFSNDGQNFSNAFTYTTTDAQKADRTARFIDVPVPNIPARFVRARFSHTQQWVFISEFQFRTAAVDTTPPGMKLVAPANGGLVQSAQPTIVIALSDDLTGVNAASETLSIDGQPVRPQVSLAEMTFTPSANLAEGQHTIVATAADGAGNVATLSGSFTVDTVPPSAAQITGVSDGQVVKGSIPLSITATDSGSGVARIDVFADGNLLASLRSPTFQFTLDTTSLAEGPHALTAHAVDAAGNLGPFGQAVHVVVDNQPLVVAINSPPAGTHERGSVTVVASVSEPVQQVQFSLGSQNVVVSAAPYQATFDLSSLPDGSQTVSVTGAGFGGESAATSVTFIVHQTPPPAPVSSLIQAVAPNGASCSVRGSSGASQPGDRVEITDLTQSAFVSATAAADGSFAANLPAGAGDSLSLVAIDEVGNRSPATTITARRPQALPAVASIQPPDGQTQFPVNGLIVVHLNAPADPTSIVTGTITLFQSTAPVNGNPSLSADGLSVTFAPAQPLGLLTAYTVKVQDAAAGSATVLAQASFTTAGSELEAESAPFTVLNGAIRPPATFEVESPAIAVLNVAAPPPQALEAESASFTVLNGNSGQPRTPLEAESPAFTLLNGNPSTTGVTREVESLPFTVKNGGTTGSLRIKRSPRKAGSAGPATNARSLPPATRTRTPMGSNLNRLNKKPVLRKASARAAGNGKKKRNSSTPSPAPRTKAESLASSSISKPVGNGNE